MTDAATAAATRRATPSLVTDQITLTKPRIISLLLVTTIAPMFITPAGLPSWSLVGWVALSGYLMAGGANAINMWYDRDIDDKMARTRLRPIPAGRMTPVSVLFFGLTLGAVAFVLFWHFVNPLSAWLAVSGLAFYVLVYTVWLKRLSPQNIVIGGAAGAIPPLVGWAAMTGSLNLGAAYLFAIIFYWTPPHFWALALNKQVDYGAAGVPMMPNVHGVHETKRQMVLYTLMLIPLTIMPSVVGITGLLYGLAAVLLGVRFFQLCWRIMHEEGVTPTTLTLYKYSLSYLALLFVAMAADRWIPFGHRALPEHVIIQPKPIAMPIPMDMADSSHQH
jgi:protoheme IX farnesyltransferase